MHAVWWHLLVLWMRKITSVTTASCNFANMYTKPCRPKRLHECGGQIHELCLHSLHETQWLTVVHLELIFHWQFKCYGCQNASGFCFTCVLVIKNRLCSGSYSYCFNMWCGFANKKTLTSVQVLSVSTATASSIAYEVTASWQKRIPILLCWTCPWWQTYSNCWYLYICPIIFFNVNVIMTLQCFDAVGWVTGRASGL